MDPLFASANIIFPLHAYHVTSACFPVSHYLFNFSDVFSASLIVLSLRMIRITHTHTFDNHSLTLLCRGPACQQPKKPSITHSHGSKNHHGDSIVLPQLWWDIITIAWTLNDHGQEYDWYVFGHMVCVQTHLNKNIMVFPLIYEGYNKNISTLVPIDSMPNRNVVE